MYDPELLQSRAFWGIVLGAVLVQIISGAFPMPQLMSVLQGLPFQTWQDVLLSWTFTGLAQGLAAFALILAVGCVLFGIMSDFAWSWMIPVTAFALAFAIPLARISVSIGLL